MADIAQMIAEAILPYAHEIKAIFDSDVKVTILIRLPGEPEADILFIPRGETYEDLISMIRRQQLRDTGGTKQ